MAFSDDDIRHIAKLSRLHLEVEDVAKYRDDLGSILDYVNKLKELDTKDVPELAHPAGLENVLRPDEVQGCDPDVRDRAIASFPRKEGDLLEVQAVFEDRNE